MFPVPPDVERKSTRLSARERRRLANLQSVTDTDIKTTFSSVWVCFSAKIPEDNVDVKSPNITDLLNYNHCMTSRI